MYTRLKHECSTLNAHLHNYNIIDSPKCSCSSAPETTFHYFYDCTFYDSQRIILMSELTELGLEDLSIPYLLHCDDLVPPSLAQSIQSAVCKFILSTHRF